MDSDDFDPAFDLVVGDLIDEIGMVVSQVISDRGDDLVVSLSATDVATFARHLAPHWLDYRALE